MGTAFLDLTHLHNDDLIGITDRAQSVSDHNDGLLARANKLVKRLLHLVLTLGVKG